jgi:hypothetical protein
MLQRCGAVVLLNWHPRITANETELSHPRTHFLASKEV